MWVIKYRSWFYSLTILTTLAAVFSIFHYGLTSGIEFSGGTSIELSFSETRPDISVVEAAMALESASVRITGEKGILIRTHQLDEQEQKNLLTQLEAIPNSTVEHISSIEPVLGSEATRKAWYSIVLVIICIVLYITFVFRVVSKPVSSWWYGSIAIVSLVHDIIIPTGIWVFMHYYFGGFEVDALFVTALLVVLGFSVHDTIVVFDRIRENLRNRDIHHSGKHFDEVVGDGVAQTYQRSINTSLTTVLALIALYVWGPEVTKHFSLILAIGVIAGTYSSIFLASPLLVSVWKWKEKGE